MRTNVWPTGTSSWSRMKLQIRVTTRAMVIYRNLFLIFLARDKYVLINLFNYK